MLQINNSMNAYSSYGTIQRVAAGSRMRGVERVMDPKDTDKTSEERKNITSISEDGDTVWVSEESRAMLEADRFGSVRAKGEMPDEQKAMPDKQRELRDERKVSQALMTEKEALSRKVRTAEIPADEIIEDKLQEEKQSLPNEELKKMIEEEMAEKKVAQEEMSQEKMIKEEMTEEEPVQEKEEGTIQIPASTVGRTEAELEQMYRNGDISKNELDKAIDSKEALREAMLEEGQEVAKTLFGMEQLSNRQKTDAIEMKNLFGENSSDFPDPQLRSGLLEQLQEIFA